MSTGLSKIDLTPREPIAKEIARRLIDHLFSGDLEPGHRLPSERQLAETLGVNRPAVREAIRSLNMLGILDIRPGSGTYFRGSDVEVLYRVFEWNLMLGERRVMELMEARAHLEEVVAGLAAQNRDDAAAATIRARLEDMRTSHADDFPAADVAFHLAIADASGNTVLRDMLRGLRTVMHSWIGRNVARHSHVTTAYRDHVPICEAIEARDADAARAAMATHMRNAAGRLLATLEPEVAERLRTEARSGLVGDTAD
ncbi:FadR/GntR family transcriptional regulator [Nocardiopsis sediminis]|uniref:FadR/GntR family transcriptional regulator n=1 Tax=Nocardiopsis sediminis TaxID=1778267 RepID=A0ABV8FJH1_9ACTN